MKPMRVYGGFVDGELDWVSIEYLGGDGVHWVGVPAIFKKRADARDRYEGVRALEIREAAKKKPRSR